MTLLMSLAVVMSTLLPAFSTPAGAEWSAPRTVYFEQTGHTLDQIFLDFWRENNGWANYGLPISEEITLANGHVVQYLEYARFEYWPEGDENGNYFVLGKVGEELRPAALQRSKIAGNSGPAGLNTMLKAWLPISADSKLAQHPDHTFVEATGHTVFGAFRDWWWATGADAFLGNPLTEEYVLSGTTYQVFEYGQLSWTPENGVQLVQVGKNLAAKYNINTKAIAQGEIPTYDESLFVPPGPVRGVFNPNGGEVWVDINLSAQYLVVYQDNNILMESYVSTGRDGWETPAGTYYVNRMLVLDTMVGDVAGESWYVPDVPHVLYFTNMGHAIHGTYWHNSFGVRLSHGCVNLPLWAAEYLYSISYVGMRLEIHY